MIGRWRRFSSCSFRLSSYLMPTRPDDHAPAHSGTLPDAAAADPTSDPGDVVGEDSFGGHTPDFEVPDPTMATDLPATAGLGVSTPSVRTDPFVLPTPTDTSFQIHDGVTLTPLTEADLGVVPDLDSVDRPGFGVTGPTELPGQPDRPTSPPNRRPRPPIRSCPGRSSLSSRCRRPSTLPSMPTGLPSCTPQLSSNPGRR